jgi:hypothetical protein
VCERERDRKQEREYMEGRDRETERVYSWKVSNKVNISVNIRKVFPLVHLTAKSLKVPSANFHVMLNFLW